MLLRLELFLLIAVTSSSLLGRAMAGDPDIKLDFLLPPDVTAVNGTFFTYTGIRHLFQTPPPPTFQVKKVSLVEFPALDGQSVSYGVFQFPAGSVNPLHTHPRSAELLLCALGSLEVGFVDTKNTLYARTLQTGDLFVFSKGLVHFQYNSDPNKPAMAISAFGSANPGTVSIRGAVFNTSISDDILAKSFKTDVATIQKIKKGLEPKA